MTNWSYAHPGAIELATRIAGLAPGDLNRVFFTSGGSEAVESAIKIVRHFHKLNGEATRTKLIAREVAYHGTSMGALAATGITDLRVPFEPLMPGGCHVPNTNAYRWPPERDPLWAADAIEERIVFEGPSTVAAVILEPVQNAGGCFVPQDGLLPARPRDLRPPRRAADLGRGHLLLGPPRPLLRLRALRLPARPHHHREGADQRLRADGRRDRLGPDRGAVHAGHGARSPTASPSEGTRWRPPWRRPTWTSSSARTCAAMCWTRSPSSARSLEGLRDIPIVGDVRGAGYFHAVELVKDKETKESFNDEESESLLRGFLSGALYERGLICRADDRGDPVIQIAPPLIADSEEFELIGSCSARCSPRPRTASADRGGRGHDAYRRSAGI